ncbi:hypothetical protein KCU91_g15575, partial [Aureobasidium melanogenum]
FTIYEGAEITGTMIHDIAALFSENYGIWGAAAQGRKQGQHLAIFLCKPEILIFWSAMFLLPDGHSKALKCVGSLNFAFARGTGTKGWRQNFWPS